jgi:hypothetical protein
MTLENDYKLTAQEVYRRFISSLPSDVTKEYYHRWLHYFMDWLQIDGEESDRLLDYDPRMLSWYLSWSFLLVSMLLPNNNFICLIEF